MIEPVTWSIDGTEIPMDWDEITATAEGGYEGASGRMAMRHMPDAAGQHSELRCVRNSGDELFVGEIDQTPKVRDGDAHITATGPVSRMQRQSERLPFQVVGAQQWADKHGEPFSATKNNKDFDMVGHMNTLGVKVNPVAYTNGDRAGWALWVQDWDLLRIGFMMSKNTDDANFAVELRTGIGPTASSDGVQVTTFSLGAANPDGTDKSYTLGDADQKDLALLCFLATANNTPGAVRKFSLHDLRTSYIDCRGDTGDWDTFYTSEVMAYLAGRCGYDTSGIVQTGTNALPLDWTSGVWPDLATYLGGLDDWPWLVKGPPDRSNMYGSLVYGPWGNHATWQVTLGSDFDEQLDFLPRYSRARVVYDTPRGVRQSSTADAVTDPFAGTSAAGQTIETPEPIELSDPQRNNSLAKQVATAAVAHLSELRARGPCDWGELKGSDGLHSAYDAFPGDLLKIAEYAPALPPQRLVTVRYTPDRVYGQLEEDIDPDREIARQIAKRHSHHHR